MKAQHPSGSHCRKPKEIRICGRWFKIKYQKKIEYEDHLCDGLTCVGTRNIDIQNHKDGDRRFEIALHELNHAASRLTGTYSMLEGEGDDKAKAIDEAFCVVVEFLAPFLTWREDSPDIRW